MVRVIRMRVFGVIVGVLGCAVLGASGQGDDPAGELRLELAWPEPASGARPEGASERRSFVPGVVMRRMADGSVRSRYLLARGRSSDATAMDEAAAVALETGLGAWLRTGRDQDPGEGIRVRIKAGNRVEVDCGDGLGCALDRESAAEVVGMIGVTRKRAKAFIGSDWGVRRDAIRKLEGPVLRGWVVSLEAGSVDLPELGGGQRVWWQAWPREGGGGMRVALRLEPQERGAAAPFISGAFLEALGAVPDALARGKSVRWESGGVLLRAFPENRAIFCRPDRQVAADVRISLETAQEAWKVLERTRGLAAWFATEVEPGLAELMARGE